MRILYLGWQATGNIGDELLFDKFQDYVYEIQVNHPIRIDSWNPMRATYDKDLSKYDRIVLGGGSLFCLDMYLDILLEAKRLHIPIATWATGMDLLPYDMIQYLQKQTPFQIQSDWKLFTKTREILKYIDILSVRGPLTAQYLRMISETPDINITVTGDPGIFVSPSKLGRSMYLPESKNQEKWIAVNWGQMKSPQYYGQEKDVYKQVFILLSQLCEQGFSVLLYTVYFADIPDTRQLYDQLRQKGYTNVCWIPKVLDAEDIVGVLSECLCSINLKLHANVLSVAAGIPTIMLGYGFKTFDFAASMQLMQTVIPTDDSDLVERVLQLINQIQSIQIPDNIRENITQEYKHRLRFVTENIINGY